ncbi:MAG: 2-dehydropantoate 2-reductase [Chloroflexi bacterium]|nr:MAG: 2-dehydropantoate 2-reductase [Chloroflexota bacterium]
MRLLIWGAGAIGGTIAGYLIRAGHDVTLVDTAADHVAALNDSGLSITGPIDEFTVAATAFTPENVPGQYETILLCVKSQHTTNAARALKPHLADDGYVVSVQNGHNEATIAGIVGEARTMGAFVNFGADYIAPGTIMFGGRGAVVLGEIDGQRTPHIEALHKALLDFDENAIITDNIFGYLWGKTAYGAILFATALTNESIADCLDDPDYRDLYIAIAQEALRVARAKGITPEAFNGFNPHAFAPGVDPAVSQQSLDEMVAFNRQSAKSHSGIWRDIAVRKRPTEVVIMEPVVTEGRAHGVSTPLTQRIIALIRELERGEREQSMENLALLKAML